MEIENFSPNSKVWIYQSSRPFTADEIISLNEKLTAFAKQWTAHNAQLLAKGVVLEDRIIMLMVDESHTAASGCSIDSSVHFIKSLEKTFDIALFDRTLLNYYNNGSLVSAHLADLPQLFDKNELNNETIILDPLVNSKATFDAGFKTTVGNSWVKSFLA